MAAGEARLRMWPALRAGGIVAAMLFAPLHLAPAADDQVDAGQVDAGVIIRTFAPIDELFKYSDRRLSVELDVRFELGSARLTAPAQGQLDALAEALRSAELRDQRFLIIGHTDASGSAVHNKLLSERRANAVKSYLVTGHGIDAARLHAIGLGEERLRNPIAPESAENRRVEIVLVSDDGSGIAHGQAKIEW